MSGAGVEKMAGVENGADCAVFPVNRRVYVSRSGDCYLQRRGPSRGVKAGESIVDSRDFPDYCVSSPTGSIKVEWHLHRRFPSGRRFPRSANGRLGRS